MLPKERKLISKLKRRNVIYIIMILILSYWIFCKYDYEESLTYRIDELEYQIKEEDSIQKINLKLDTLKFKEVTPVKIEKRNDLVKKEIKKQKQIQKVDTSNAINEKVIKIETDKDTIN